MRKRLQVATAGMRFLIQRNPPTAQKGTVRSVVLTALQIVAFPLILLGYVDVFLGLPLLIDSFELFVSSGLANLLLPLGLSVYPVVAVLFRLKATKAIFFAVVSGFSAIVDVAQSQQNRFHAFLHYHPEIGATEFALACMIIVYMLYVTRCNFRRAYGSIEVAVGGWGISSFFSTFDHLDVSVLDDPFRSTAIYTSLVGSFYVIMRGFGNLEDQWRPAKPVADLHKNWRWAFYEAPQSMISRLSHLLPNLSGRRST